MGWIAQGEVTLPSWDNATPSRDGKQREHENWDGLKQYFEGDWAKVETMAIDGAVQCSRKAARTQHRQARAHRQACEGALMSGKGNSRVQGLVCA